MDFFYFLFNREVICLGSLTKSKLRQTGVVI